MARRIQMLFVIFFCVLTPLAVETILLWASVSGWLSSLMLPVWLVAALLLIPHIAACAAQFTVLEIDDEPRRKVCALLCTSYAAGVVWSVSLFCGGAAGLACLWQTVHGGLLATSAVLLFRVRPAGCIAAAVGSGCAFASAAMSGWLASVV